MQNVFVWAFVYNQLHLHIMKPLQSFFAVVAGILATTAKTFCYRNLGSMPSSISTLTE